MRRYLFERFVSTVPALWLVVTLVFLLIHLVPGDPVQLMLGEGARPGDVAALRQQLGLNEPLATQYIHYWWGLVRGEWGESLRFRDSVLHLIGERYPATLALAFFSLLVSVGLAIPAGVTAAAHRGKWPDRAIGIVSLAGLSFPNFALGPILILVVSVKLGWLPVSGRGGMTHMVLPAVTLGAALAAILTRMVRSAMLEELSSDYVRTARAKGVSEKSVFYRHALKNALIPILTVIGLQLGTLLAGAIVTEMIFAWPGLGRLTVQAISARDYALLQGCVLVIGLSYVLVNLLTDLAYSAVDPRIRRG